MNKEEMIQTLNNDLRNEWKHLRFYLYHASAIVGLHREEFREFLYKSAESEMKHVTQFSDLILGLGGVATEESNDFEKFTKPEDILLYALNMEKEVVSNYVQRIKDSDQLGGVEGQWIEIFMEDQIKHSREDVDHLNQIVVGI
jgi:bacterioferritin (cytochrome b1)